MKKNSGAEPSELLGVSVVFAYLHSFSIAFTKGSKIKN
jgi:hypothetical protein